MLGLPIDERKHVTAWTAFWREQGDASLCLAGLPPEARQAIADHWSCFASGLPRQARVLDLGAGTGVVARALLASRPDLRVTGIDSASVPCPRLAPFRLVGNVAMEDLPFDRETFDAAVSQFGFEYGTVAEAAREAARVLAPGAPFSFLVHHGGSSILAHNRQRNFALRELRGEGTRAAFLAGNAAALERQAEALRRRHPHEALVDPVIHALSTRISAPVERRTAIWQAVTDSLAPECEILDALESACVPSDALERWLGCFDGSFDLGPVEVLSKSSGEAIAWKVSGMRRAIPARAQIS